MEKKNKPRLVRATNYGLAIPSDIKQYPRVVLGMVIAAEDIHAARKFGVATMKEFYPTARLRPCHHTMTEGGEKLYCYQAELLEKPPKSKL